MTDDDTDIDQTHGDWLFRRRQPRHRKRIEWTTTSSTTTREQDDR